MVEKIFGNIITTREKVNINDMLRRLYRSNMAVDDALHNYNVKLSNKSQMDYLSHLVISVRENLVEPEYLDIDESKIFKMWHASAVSGKDWACIRISTEEEWNKVVDWFVKDYDVDTAWGTFKGGMDRFAGEDIYMFRKYIDEFYIDNPGSNWDGCKSSHTFLQVTCLKAQKDRYLGYLKNIEDRESEAWKKYFD